LQKLKQFYLGRQFCKEILFNVLRKYMPEFS